MAEQKKAFVVTQGEYSDRSIMAVFSTREKADEYCCLHETYAHYQDELSVDEFDLDIPAAQYYHYMLFMLVDSGKVTHEWKTLDRRDQSTKPCVLKDRDKAQWCIRAYGRDREAALKTASDFRAKVLAEREGL